MPSFKETVRDMFWNQSANACGCMGPQDGDPVCPCAMKYVKVVDGHFIQITDLGKVGDPKFVVKDMVSEYNVYIAGIKSISKINVIKAVRNENYDLNLQEARDLVESAPVLVHKSVLQDEAEHLKQVYEAAGAFVEIK